MTISEIKKTIDAIIKKHGAPSSDGCMTAIIDAWEVKTGISSETGNQFWMVNDGRMFVIDGDEVELWGLGSTKKTVIDGMGLAAARIAEYCGVNHD